MGKKGGGGGSSQTVVQKADPWVGVQPSLNNLYSSANSWYNTPSAGYYPNSTVAPMDWRTTQAMDLITHRALAGSPVLNDAKSYTRYLVNGGGLGDNQFRAGVYMNNNPFVQGNYLAGDATAQGQFLRNNKTAQGYYLNNDPTINGDYIRNNSTILGKNLQNNPFANGSYERNDPFVLGKYLKTDPFANGSMLSKDKTAQGYYLDNQNPYLPGLVNAASAPVVENFQNAVAPALASQFSLAGRTGSNSHRAAFETQANSLSRELGDISTNIYGTAYENERNRMQQSTSQLYGLQANAYSDEVSRILSALQSERGLTAQQYGMERGLQEDVYGRERGFQESARGRERQLQENAYGMERQLMSNAYQQEIDRISQQFGLERGYQFQADEGERNRRLQAAGLAPQLAQADYMDPMALLNVGAMKQGYNQQLLNDSVARWNYARDEPLARMQAYNGILTGAAPYAGSSQQSNSTQTLPAPNRVTSTLGGGLAGYALGSAMGFGIPGMIIGGLGGLFG